MALNNFDKKIFLAEFWQQKPLVIRKAFDQPFWLEPDELAGLSCEENIESRIIRQHDKQWNVEHGPFDEAHFSTLPEQDWTLLVQAVDQWVPEVKDILEDFDFLPSWRLDDVMVSYGPKGGTVSQHYDFFDVFLIQGKGRRSWQVGEICGSHSELVPNTSVRILKEFNAVMDVTLEPGDMLYIPAKHAHLGVSLEDSLTYSVGFKAPSVRDMVDGVATLSLENLLEDTRYQDTSKTLLAEKGEIPASSIAQIREQLSEALLDDHLISSWFGRYVTEQKYSEIENGSSEDDGEEEEFNNLAWVDELKAGVALIKNPASRFAYTALNGKGLKAFTLFVDGVEMCVDPKLAIILANSSRLNTAEIMPLLEVNDNRVLIESLLKSGALFFEDDVC